MSSIIVAVGDNQVIGNNGELPWHIPADLKHFRQTTTGGTVVMGRITYESIFKKMRGPLPDRRNIVLSNNLKSVPKGFELKHSLEEIEQDSTIDRNILYYIGGAKIFREVIDSDLVDKIYLTKIKAEFKGDVFMPSVDMSKWRVASKKLLPPGKDNKYSLEFIELVKA